MKGTVVDLIIVFVMLLVAGLVILTSSLFLTEFRTAVNESGIGFNDSYFIQGEVALQVFNSGFIVIAISLALGTMIFAYYIKGHPAFIIVSIILMVVLVFISPIFTNIFEEFASDPLLLAEANKFDQIILFMRSLPLFASLMGALMVIVIHAKTGDSVDA